MKTILLAFCLLFITSLAIASDYVCFDGNGYITSKHKSVDGTNLKAKGCIQISRTVYNSLTRWHKVENDLVIEMSQSEKDAIFQAEADAQVQALEEATQELRLEMKEVITALIQVINVRLPQGEKITREELIQKIKDNRN